MNNYGKEKISKTFIGV